MKIFVGTKSVEGLSIALTLQAEGQGVVWKGLKGIGRGLAVPGSINKASQCDLVYLDDASFAPLAKRLTKEGVPVFGPSLFGNLLEEDPNLADLVMPFTEVSNHQWVGGFYGGGRFLNPCFKATVYDRLMDGDKGAEVKCAGLTLEPIAPVPMLAGISRTLNRCDYRGFIAVQGAGNGVKFWCNRPYDFLQAYAEILREPLGDVLLKVAVGNGRKIKASNDVAIAVRVSVPPYPYKGEYIPKSGGILGLSDPLLRHLWMMDIGVDDEGKLVCAGTSGLLGVATARGRNIREARRRVYRTIKSLKVEGLQYRSDVGA